MLPMTESPSQYSKNDSTPQLTRITPCEHQGNTAMLPASEESQAALCTERRSLRVLC